MSNPLTGRRSLRALALVAAAATTLALASCSSNSDGGSADGGAATLTLYSGQHEDLAKALAAGFQEETGIQVQVRAGKDAEMVNQIIEEGDRSKADIVITEEPGPLGQLADAGLLSPVDAAALAVPDQRMLPSDGDWLPFAGRSRVLFFNPEKISEDQLPASILDLANPEWKGRFAYAPSGGFKSTVSYLINTIGPDATLTWLEAIKENGVNEQKNGQVRDSVEAGQHEFGLSNHYYWYILAKDKGGQDKLTSRVHYMSNGDAGALLLASGAAVVKSSDNQAEAQEFLAWLVDPAGGQAIVGADTPQYPLTPGVSSSYELPALDTLQPPAFDQGSLQNTDQANELMKQSGII